MCFTPKGFCLLFPSAFLVLLFRVEFWQLVLSFLVYTESVLWPRQLYIGSANALPDYMWNKAFAEEVKQDLAKMDREAGYGLCRNTYM